MGLFLDTKIAEQRIAAATRTKRVDVSKIIDPLAVGCESCSLKQTWSHITSPKMKLSGNVHDAEILIIGEGPGEAEDQQGKAFVGRSGELLRDNIPRRHLSKIAFQNAVRCRPDGNATPSAKDVHACSVFLNNDIDSLPLKAIVGVGAVPLHIYFPGAQIMRVRGARFPIMTGRGPIWYYPILHPSFVLRMTDDSGRDDNPARPVFESDLRRFFSHYDRWEDPYIYSIKPSDVIIVTNAEDALALIEQMQEPVGVDIETSRLHPYEVGALIITAAVSDGKTTISFSCEHPEAPTDWGLDVLLYVLLTKRWIAHNAAFELGWFQWYWPDSLTDFMPFDDTMALGRLYHEGTGILSLEDMSVVHLGVNIKQLTNVDAANIMAYSLEDVLPYNGVDALSSALIWRKLHKQVNQDHYKRLLNTVVVVTDMNLEGLSIDLHRSLDLQMYWRDKHDKVIAGARKLYEVRRFQEERGIEFNIASGEHVGVALTAYSGISLPRTDSTKKIVWKTDEETLQPYVDTNPLAKAVIEAREASKMESTYIQPCIEAASKYVDGRIHPTYTTMRTHTFRFSSEDPNAQNWPSRNKEQRQSKEQIVADPGCIMAKFDFGQLQVRIEGMASRDRHLCDILISGYDMHSHWRDHILKVYPGYWNRLLEVTGEKDEEKILKGGRDAIKSDFVFASLFGASAKSCSDRTGIPLEFMQRVSGDFWDEFKGVQNWIKARRNEYKDTGTITTLSGHVRRGIAWGNEPINHPIQMIEAYIVKEVLADLNALARREKNKHFLPRIEIHDDITLMLPNDSDLPNYIDVIQKIMVKCRYPWQIVPLVVDCNIGDNWGSFEKVGEFKGDYQR